MQRVSHRGFIENRYLLALFGIFISGVLIFAGSRALPLITGPLIYLDAGAPAVEQGKVTISGRVTRSNRFTINDNIVIPNQNGVFIKELFLTDGHTIITLVAKDRFGRSLRITIPIYIPYYGTQKNNKEETSGSEDGEQREQE